MHFIPNDKIRRICLMKKILMLISVVSVLFAQTAAGAEFNDISAEFGYAQSVGRLAEFGIINGFEDGSYHPDDTITRAQFAKTIVCMLDKEEEAKANSVVTSFFDVDQYYWGVPYINYVAKNSIIKGYTDGSFHPEAPITLSEAATVLLRTLGYNEEDVGYYWPDNYVDKAVAMEITKGVSAGIYEAVTRAEAAMMIDAALFSDAKESKDEFIKTLGYELVEDAVIVATSDEDSTLKSNEIKLGDDKIYEYKMDGRLTALSYAENLIVDEDGFVVAAEGYVSGEEGIEAIKEQGYGVIENCYLVASSGDDRELASDEIRTSKGVYSVKDTDILNKTEEHGTLVLNKDKKVIYAFTEKTPYTEYVVEETIDGGISYISSNKTVPLALPADFPIYVDYEEKKGFSEVTDKFVSGAELTVYNDGGYSYGVLDTDAGYSVIDECFIIATKDDDKSLSADQVRTSGGTYKVKSTDILSQSGGVGTAVIKDNKIEQFIPTQLDSISVVANKFTDNTLEYIKKDGTKDTFKFDNTFVTYFDYEKSTYDKTKEQISSGTDITFYGKYGDWDFAVIDTTDDIKPMLSKKNYTGEENSIEGVDIVKEGLTVYRDGKASSLSEIAVNDVIYYNKKTNTIDVYTDKVSGIYSDALPSKAYVSSVMVGGKEYTLDTTAVSALDASGGSFDIGERVTLLLGKDNKVAFAVELADSTLYDYGVLIDTYINIKDNVSDKGQSEYIAKVFMPDGAEYEYAAEKDYKDYKGDLVKLEFNGDVVSISKAPTSKLSGTIDKSARKIGTTTVLKNAGIIQRLNSDDEDEIKVALINWDTLDIGSISKEQTITYIPANSFGDVQILYVKDITNLAYEAVMVTAASNTEGGSTYKVLKDGKTQTITTHGKRSVVAGVPAMYKMTGSEVDDIFNMYKIASGSDIAAIEGGRIMINNTVYETSDSVVYYSIDNNGSTTKYKTLSLSDMQKLKSSEISKVTLYSDVSELKNGTIKAVVVNLR